MPETQDRLDRVLVEDAPTARADNSELMRHIAEFEKNWREFMAIKDQAPPAVGDLVSRNYRTS